MMSRHLYIPAKWVSLFSQRFSMSNRPPYITIAREARAEESHLYSDVAVAREPRAGQDGVAVARDFSNPSPSHFYGGSMSASYKKGFLAQQIFWTLIVALIVSIPTDFFLIIRHLATPEGFWQEFALGAAGLLIMGGTQLAFLVIGLILIAVIWLGDHF